MGITIRDVARAAGVSTATVSRALRGLPNVEQETRLRVCAAAAELDYVVSPSASRLASGRTGSIAVVTPSIARWFFATVLSGIEAELHTAGLDLLLMGVDLHQGQPRPPLAPRLRRRVDGVLAIAFTTDDPELDEILSLGLPTSLVGTRRPGVASVSIDDGQTGRTAAEHLLSLGHTRIGVIGGSPIRAPRTAGYEREQGFLAVLAEAGIEFDPRLLGFGDFTVTGGEEAMGALLADPEPPTAVFAMSDEMAFGAMRAMRARGLEPGRDISLIGIDDHDMSGYLGLTTVAQPVSELGRLATRALVEQIAAGPDRGAEVRLPTKLVSRTSTRPRA